MATSPLSSPAIGTASNDLIDKCVDTSVRPARPSPPPTHPPLALAFSGGGFRASLASLGSLRFLFDAGLGRQIRYVSSVSGGSLANGLFAFHYEELRERDFSPESFDGLVIRPFVDRITTTSLKVALILNIWRTIGPKTRTDVLGRMFDRWFFHERLLEQLPSDCRFIFNAASVTTGVRFGFERDVIGDWVMGVASTKGSGLKLAQAVAASAAVPGAFAPFKVKGVQFPCADGRVAKLLDGGAYDNSGMEAIDDLPHALVVAVNAGGLFRTGAYGGIPIVRDLQRANSLLYRQSTGLRRHDLVERFKVWEKARDTGQPSPGWGRQGVLFGLATTVDATEEWLQGRDERGDLVEKLAGYKTSFDRFSPEICHQLIYRGWWLTGATLSNFHRNRLHTELPTWRDL